MSKLYEVLHLGFYYFFLILIKESRKVVHAKIAVRLKSRLRCTLKQIKTKQIKKISLTNKSKNIFNIKMTLTYFVIETGILIQYKFDIVEILGENRPCFINSLSTTVCHQWTCKDLKKRKKVICEKIICSLGSETLIYASLKWPNSWWVGW